MTKSYEQQLEEQNEKLRGRLGESENENEELHEQMKKLKADFKVVKMEHGWLHENLESCEKDWKEEQRKARFWKKRCLLLEEKIAKYNADL